jgi:hypothetical protein
MHATTIAGDGIERLIMNPPIWSELKGVFGALSFADRDPRCIAANATKRDCDAGKLLQMTGHAQIPWTPIKRF